MRRTFALLVALAALVVPVSTARAHTRIFDDEFNGSSVDLGKWEPSWFAGNTPSHPVNGAELSCYDPKQVAEGYGSLVLTATHRSCLGYQWASGLVNTRQHFLFTYGTITARIWLDGSTKPLDWPAVWTDGTGHWPDTGENDVMEILDGHACFHFHSPAGGPGGCASGNYTGWHTYSSTWSPGKVTYSYDGGLVGTITQGITGAPMYVVLNLAVSTQISPPAVAAHMLVDRIVVTQ